MKVEVRPVEGVPNYHALWVDGDIKCYSYNKQLLEDMKRDDYKPPK